MNFKRESEQFSYILEEEKKEAIQKVLALENEEANEYIQSKYISKQKGFIWVSFFLFFLFFSGISLFALEDTSSSLTKQRIEVMELKKTIK